MFIYNFFTNSNSLKCITKQDENIEDKKNVENHIIEELSNCQSDLFLTKNTLEQVKNMPDTRKDIIELLFVLKDVEYKLGKERNFSNECVKLFSLASRIQVVQEYVLKYKKQFFESNCMINNNEDIFNMILPFQVKILEQQRKEQQNGEKMPKRILNEIKYQITKIFIKTNIQKSDIENSIDEGDYNKALQILISGDFERSEDFNKLYSSISVIKNMKEMINGIYDILKTNN